MSSTPRLLTASLLLAALALPAEAQLGGLRNKIKKAAGGEATATVAQEAGAIAPPPAFDKVTLEITGERLDALLKASPKLKAAYEKIRQANSADERDKRQRAYDAAQKKRREWEKCRDDAREAGMKALQKRMEVLQGQGAFEQMQKIMDSVQKAAPKTEAEAQKRDAEMVGKRCGAEPPEPADPDDASGNLNSTIQEETGINGRQWVIMHERLLAALGEPKRRYENGRVSGLSELESTAILDRYEELRKLRGEDWFAGS